MPKKRSIAKGYSKRLQRLYRRAAVGPTLPEPESPREAPAAPTEPTGTPKTHHDMAKLAAAQRKRLRKATRRLESC